MTTDIKKTSTRYEFIDIAKGIGMISIILGHMNFHDMSENNPFVVYVFQYHVPLFFFISGLFLSHKRSWRRTVAKKAQGLLLPYLVTVIAVLVTLLLFWLVWATISPPSTFSSLKEFLLSAVWGAGYVNQLMPEGVRAIGAIWFLEALFVAFIEVYIITGVVQGFLPGLLITLSLAGASLYLKYICFPPFNILQGFCGGLYVYCGYVYRKKYGLKFTSNVYLILLATAITLLAIYRNEYVNLVGPDCYSGIALLSSFSSVYLVILLSIKLADNTSTLARILEFFGRNSLCILCIHLWCMDIGYLVISIWLNQLLSLPDTHNAVRVTNLMLQLLTCVIGTKLYVYIGRKKSLQAGARQT